MRRQKDVTIRRSLQSHNQFYDPVGLAEWVSGIEMFKSKVAKNLRLASFGMQNRKHKLRKHPCISRFSLAVEHTETLENLLSCTN